MDSLKVPEDVNILRLLQQPKNRYEINKDIRESTYPGITKKVNRLMEMGLVFKVREKDGPGPGKVKYFLITSKGRSVLRGFEEAERRE